MGGTIIMMINAWFGTWSNFSSWKKNTFGLYYNIILFILFHNLYILSTWFNFHIKHNFLISQNWMTRDMEPSCDPCRLNLRPQVNWDPGVINFCAYFGKNVALMMNIFCFLAWFWAHFGHTSYVLNRFFYLTIVNIRFFWVPWGVKIDLWPRFWC